MGRLEAAREVSCQVVPMVRVTGKNAVALQAHSQMIGDRRNLFHPPPACVAADCSAELRRPRRFQPPEVDRVVAFKTFLFKGISGGSVPIGTS